MRIALIAAVSAACLVTPVSAALASDSPIGGESKATVLASSFSQSPEVLALDRAERLEARAANPATGLRDTLSKGHAFRIERKMLEFFPIAGNPLHLFAGFQKDKKVGGKLRDDLSVEGGSFDRTRRVSPGFGIDYDQALGGSNKLSIDAGLSLSRNKQAQQLIRMAGLGASSDRLGARSARFGPAAHISFVHTF